MWSRFNLVSTFKVISIFTSVLLIIFCFYSTSSYFDFTVLDLAGLVVPYIVLVNILLLIYWVFRKDRFFFLVLTPLILWYFILGPFFKIFSLEGEHPSEAISVLTYNVFGFGGYYKYRGQDIVKRTVDFVNKQDADIVCFQEFDRWRISSTDFKDYPYQFVYQFNNKKRYSPLAILSKFPIINQGSLNFQGTGNNTIYADIVKKTDTIRVYNVHLQSLAIQPGSFKRENPLRIYNRLGSTFEYQTIQAEQIIKHSRNSPFPKIICGDFNNTQYSRIYQRIRSRMKDSYLEKGSGFGRTLEFKFLPFRIDYILTDPDFEVLEHKNFEAVLSDHFPVMASI
ncbi:endonuclease/exonuclease/phosphatase family protein, partial [Muriicola sp.]|uniref:endonuclease/exonuclease/phosphatase family protein n=1 Tax=Muriicola sp. TaxID=2020856 RepID=UPI003C76910E